MVNLLESKLPKVYANPIKVKLKNTQETYYSNLSLENVLTSSELNKKINQIFKAPNHVYKSDVLITYGGVTYLKTIVGKDNQHLFTLDGELIPLSQITNLQKKN